MSFHGSSARKLARVRPQSDADERGDVGREEVRVQLLLGFVALGSIAVSVFSYVHPYG